MENYYDDLPPIKDFLEKYSLTAKKSLGQNFLLDLNLTDKIAAQIKDIQNSVVIEIGAGPAGLTRALLKRGAKKVITVELDTVAIDILTEIKQTYPDKLVILNQDALTTNYEEIKKEYCKDGEKLVIAANLPYNISVPLTVGWLKNIYTNNLIDEMVLMFQKEVAQRITASPDNKNYGRISILAQLITECRKCFDIGRLAFTPPPKVTSSVVRFVPHKNIDKSIDIKKLEKVVKFAFGKRRKMVRASLKEIMPNIEEILKELDIKETLRAENLTVEDFCKLSKYI